jgi:uncharacterized protein YukE
MKWLDNVQKQIADNWTKLKIWWNNFNLKSEKQFDNVHKELKLNMEKLQKKMAENWTGLQIRWNSLKSDNRLDNVQKELNLHVEKLKNTLRRIGQDFKFGKTA